MGPNARRPDLLRGKVFNGPAMIASGVVTPSELRSKAWQRLFRGVYADAKTTVDHTTRCVAAARWLLPPDSVIAGPAAAAFYRASAPAPDKAIDVIVQRRGFGPVGGLRIHTSDVSAADVRMIAGVRVTSPLRTCADLARWLDIADAIAIIDQLMHTHVVTRLDLQGYASAMAGRRGWRPPMRAAGLADGRSESPMESRLRVRLVLAGLPRPEAQFVVRQNGRFIARVDLAWPELKIAIEYDGLWHNDRQQFHQDRQRLNALTAAGWTVLHVTAQRMRDDFDSFVAEVRATIKERSRN
jgi:very-short-patch-repair endonuclease